MKKRLFTAMALVMLAIFLPLTVAHAFETFTAETETRLYKPEKSYNGYVQTCPGNNTGGGTVYLIDLWGNVYHSWVTKGGTPRLQEDGTLWSIFYIQDWDGNVIWDFVPTRDAPEAGTILGDHDQRKMWNKKLNQWTMLINCNRNLTAAEALAAGVDPAIVANPGTRLNQYNFVIEVNMDKKIVWRWNQWDHACQTQNPAWPNYVSDIRNAPGKFDINWRTDAQQPNSQPGLGRDWLHVNSIDYDEESGHVAINSRSFSTFWVVDHDKTFVSTTDFAANAAAAAGPNGDIIYRFGNPSFYKAGKAPSFLSEGDQQMYGSHNIQWIRAYAWDRPRAEAGDTWPDPMGYTKSGVALPGAGNFLIFDNGCFNPTGMRSRILEIDPRIGASGTVEVPHGQYIDPTVAGYQSTSATYRKNKQVTWLYQSASQSSFYSSFISSMIRLPNGNTSIDAGGNGHMFEVTPSGEVVWEYIMPGFAGPNVKYVMSDSNLVWQTDSNQYRGTPYFTYRHSRYAADFPGFTGKNLTSKGTLTGLVPQLTGEGRTKPASVTYFGFGFPPTGGIGGGGGGVGGGSGGGGGY